MKLQDMTDGQLEAQYLIVRDQIAQWTEIIRETIPGEIRDEYDRHRNNLHARACDMRWEMGQRK